MEQPQQKKKAKQLAQLIAELRPLVQSLGDATVVVPLIKEYMEISVKNGLTLRFRFPGGIGDVSILVTVELLSFLLNGVGVVV